MDNYLNNELNDEELDKVTGGAIRLISDVNKQSCTSQIKRCGDCINFNSITNICSVKIDTIDLNANPNSNGAVKANDLACAKFKGEEEL